MSDYQLQQAWEDGFEGFGPPEFPSDPNYMGAYQDGCQARQTDEQLQWYMEEQWAAAQEGAAS